MLSVTARTVRTGQPVPSGTTNALRSVWGSGSGNVYAVGAYGTIVHSSGGAWSANPGGTSNALRAIWGSGPNDIYAVGDSGTIMHYTPEPATLALFALAGLLVDRRRDARN